MPSSTPPHLSQKSPLKLIAQDLEDLKILIAHLQDAIIPLVSMSYDVKEKIFRTLAHRFCWESPATVHEQEEFYHRVHSGLEIHHVTSVRHKGLHAHEKENRSSPLLTIQTHEEGILHFIFSGGQELQVAVEALHVRLGDVGVPWPTQSLPQHDIDEGERMEREALRG